MTEKDAILELAKAIAMLAQAIQVHTQVIASPPDMTPKWSHTTWGGTASSTQDFGNR